MSYWEEKVTLGSLQVPRFIGAPLDGITDSPFRKLVRNFSKDALLYTEMRHVGCVANDKGAARALDFEQKERPLNYQFSANNTNFIELACQRVQEAGVDAIDLNIGCPARAVIKSGSGSSLMADEVRLAAILKEFRRHAKVPFTVKMRAGFKEKNAVRIAQLIQDCGADALAIHPRLQTEQFTGVPDYALAAQVKKSVSIPVFISGGVVNWPIANRVYQQTGVDGFLIGRGMWSKPWKLQELTALSQGKSFNLTQEIIKTCALEHVEQMLQFYGAHGIRVFRKHLPFYIKAKPCASELRQRLAVSDNPQEVKEGLQEFFGA